ncbi:MAG: hypothetical protein Q9159_004257 [Coniocarpon cinnabarinum]
MATENALPTRPHITLPDSFNIHAQDPRLERKNPDPPAPTPADPAPPLGVLSAFTGTFVGRGLNLIFRPNSAAPTTTTFPSPIPAPQAPNPPNENVLEINLTTETLSFSKPLGSVPNRGLEAQNDIFLNGVPYIQAVNDVTNPATGKADGPASGIHFEPGLFMHVPATKNDPVIGESISRMASIPHGTTINAQGLAPAAPFQGAPQIAKVDITPFVVANPANLVRFAAQTAASTNTPRLPQDLSQFIANGTITQAILDDPNTVLRDANKGKDIRNTTVFTLSTNPSAPFLNGGTANIDFLQGGVGPQSQGPNASAVQMSSIFWINAVSYTLDVPAWKPGQPPLRLTPKKVNDSASLPTFTGTPPKEIPQPKTIQVMTNEIQYSQNVGLNFAGLTWPHVSVATLGVQGDLPVPEEAWGV